MNYYNPYFYNIPSTQQPSLFNKMFCNLSFGRILNGTERALNFANQAIPLIKQVKPIIGNAKTMFKIMNEFKRNESSSKKSNNTLTETGTSFYA